MLLKTRLWLSQDELKGFSTCPRIVEARAIRQATHVMNPDPWSDLAYIKVLQDHLYVRSDGSDLS